MATAAQARPKHGWIGVDLDGTLAHYDGWQGSEHIGAVVEAMKQRVLEWHHNGQQVKIFTARAHDPAATPLIWKWLNDNGMPAFEVTNVKDFSMIELWDDRCVQVIPNTGMTALDHMTSKKFPKSDAALTTEMQNCVKYVQEHGTIHRYRGAIWQKAGLGPGDHFPDMNKDYFGSTTILALQKRGVLEPCESKPGERGQTFVTAYKLRTGARII